MFDVDKEPQTLQEILAIYAQIDASTSGWTTCYMRDYGVVHAVKEKIRTTRSPMFQGSIY